MGRNSQRRRANERRANARATTSTGDFTLDEVIHTACLLAHGPQADTTYFPRAMAVLHQLEETEDPLDRPSTRVLQVLRQLTRSVLDGGWQPADLAHVVRREWTQRTGRLMIALIADHSRKAEAPTRAPHAWIAQLHELGILDAAGTTVVGGHGDLFAVWSRAERLHPEDALIGAVQLLAQVRRLPPLPILITPPSKWGASNRGLREVTTTGEIDEKALRLIRAMLAKAEATTFEAEAEAFTAKAQELMTRHSIDAAVMAAAEKGHVGGIESRRVHIDNPYGDEKATLLAAIADVNSVRSIWASYAGFSTLMGFPVDLQLTDLLFTSLLVQATHASTEATKHEPRLRTASFRRAFLIAFAERVAERLEATRRHVAQQAQAEYGNALLPILADRRAAVDKAYEEAFPDATAMRSRRLNGAGWAAGRAAAERADIGVGEAITGG